MRSTTSAVAALTAALAIVAGCGDDTAEQGTLADPDHVIDHFIIILQGPRTPHDIERSAAEIELVTLERARIAIASAGGGTIQGLQQADAWSEEIWLLEIPGVYGGVPGRVFGVVDPNSGLAGGSAVVPD